ncbi:MAG: diguanylate cyclase [Alphaproteobacteria bacterium]|nr:diguanylate cyclase [Alphaproteobacteria bacterium]
MSVDQIRTPRATIAWLSTEATAFDAARSQFAKAGYRLLEGEEAADAELAVVDFRNRRVTAKAASRLAALMRRKTPECGIVYIAPPFLGAAERAHLRRSGDLVLCEDDLRGVVETCRQRLRIRNIAEESGERLKTIAALSRLSDFPPIEASSEAPSVLVAGPPGPAALAALAAAERTSARCAGVLSAGQAIRALETNIFDCAVFLPTTDSDALAGLARAMRRHRRLRDTPVLIVAENEGLRAKLAPYWGADALLLDHVCDDLGPRLAASTRRARLLAAMRRFLTACSGDNVRDRLSGAFTPQFFGQHGARVFARGAQTGRADSLIAIRLAPLAAVEAGGTRLLVEAARLINRVTRAEDCVGRLTSDSFVVLLAATPLEDAAAAARRIEGVIANTMFRSRSGDTPFGVATAAAVVARAENGGLEETIAAALVKLSTAKPRTAER